MPVKRRSRQLTQRMLADWPMGKTAHQFAMLLLLAPLHSQAEVEIDDKPALLSKQHIAGVDSDQIKPLPLPKFVNPFDADTDDVIASKVKVLRAESQNLHIAKSLTSRPVNVTMPEGVDVEIWLPRNRCELGWIRWGTKETGISECQVLGRGQSIFGSLKLLAGLQATQKSYATWNIGELPRPLTAVAVKNKEHFGSDTEYTHCMFKPESENNGSTITTRENSKIGHFLLDTGAKLHRGKEKWGRIPDSKSYLLPVRMNKIDDPSNRKYSKEGILIYRYDIWMHSYEDAKDEFPLEAHSTWGCPRLPRSCMQEVQQWVAEQNALDKKPYMIVHQELP